MRECLEETGYTVTVKKLAAVYEMIFMGEAFRALYARHVRKVHFIFLCEATDVPCVPPTELDTDTDMQGAEWVEFSKVDMLPLYPVVVKENLLRMLEAEETLFLGSRRED